MATSTVRRLLDRISLLRLGKEQFARKKGVTIGHGCRVLSNVVTTEPWLLTIGDRVTVSTDVRFITHDGSGWLVRDERGRRFRYAPIVVGNDVFIGASVIVLPGVSIGDHVVIGAGSVVTKDVESNTVAAGVPAKRVSSWTDFEARALAWPAESDKRGSTYRERVNSIVM